MNSEQSIRMKEMTYWKPTRTERKERPLAEREKEPLRTMAGLKEVL